MNLGQIVERAESRLRFAPNTRAHAKDIKAEASIACAKLLEMAPWPFLRKTIDYEVLADEADIGTATFSQNQTEVPLLTGTEDANWVGAYVTGPDGVDYEIAGIKTGAFKLVEPYGGTTASASFTIKYLRWALPADCQQVYSMIDRENRQNVIRLRRPDERAYLLSEDDTGTGMVSVEEDTQQEYAPLATLVATLTASATGLTVGVRYRYLYTFLIAGRESGASNIVEVLVTTGNRHVTLSAIENTTADSGRVKRIYRDAGTGVFQYLAEVAETGITYLDNGTVTPSRTSRFEEVTSLRRYFRLWTRPSTDTTYEIQYHRKPPRIVADSDVPAFPDTYHDILVSMVVRSFREREKMDTTSIAKEIVDLVAQMTRAYFGDQTEALERQGWSPGGSSFGGRPVELYGRLGRAQLLP